VKSKIFCLLSTAVCVLLAMILAGCGGSDNPTNPGGSGSVIGVLLSGDDASPSLDGTSNHGPYPVTDAEYLDNLVTTRLEAIFDPEATVGEVNAALTSAGARISCMRTGQFFVELAIPEVTDESGALAICTNLLNSGAFISAHPAYRPAEISNAEYIIGTPAGQVISFLESAHFTAAWNARSLTTDNNSPATVLIADHFRRLQTHSEIPSQTFPSTAGGTEVRVDAAGKAKGNHGFQVAGIIGAAFNDVGSSGVFPGPENLLNLPCIPVTSLGTWTAVMSEISSHFPSSGQFVVNTSISYSDTAFGYDSKRDRIEHALYWRSLVASIQNRFLHTQAAGNFGITSTDSTNASYITPFAIAARFGTPLEMLQGTQVSAQDTASLMSTYQLLVQTNTAVGNRLNNTLIVGSSNNDGVESAFSNKPSDLRMIGEQVTVPCDVADVECGPGSDVPLQSITTNGTSFAAPQVAGLAAYMWSLKPDLSVAQTREILQNCFGGSWIDAYKAVLSLDNGISTSTARVRLAVLDVADNGGQAGTNGSFDEHDLKMYLDSLPFYEDLGAEQTPVPKDQSRFDLNGDGYTGDPFGIPTTFPFDLDANYPPSYSQVNFTTCLDTFFNEAAVSDYDILYYYGFSDLYSGDEDIRDSLLGCGKNIELFSRFADVNAVAGFGNDFFQQQASASALPMEQSLSATLFAVSPACEEEVTSRADAAVSALQSFGGPHDQMSALDINAAYTLSFTSTEGHDNCEDQMNAAASATYAISFEVKYHPVDYSLDYSADVAIEAIEQNGGTFDVILQGYNEEGIAFEIDRRTANGPNISIMPAGSAGTLEPGSYSLTVNFGIYGYSPGEASMSTSLIFTDNE